jgi:hypothetical protein
MGHLVSVVLDGGGGVRSAWLVTGRKVIPAGDRGVSLVSGVAVHDGIRR